MGRRPVMRLGSNECDARTEGPAATCSATAERSTCLGDWVIENDTFHVFLGLRGCCSERMLFTSLLTDMPNNLSTISRCLDEGGAMRVPLK